MVLGRTGTIVLGLGTEAVLEVEIAEFTAELILGPSADITELMMSFCLEDEVRVEVNLFCPSPEFLLLEPVKEEEDEIADWTAVLILGWMAARICEMMSDCDRRDPELVLLTPVDVVWPSSTPAKGPVHGPGLFLNSTAPLATSLVSE